MAILRHEHARDFTVIPNRLLRDGSLSLRDAGLLCVMLSLPDDWEFSVRGLTTLFPHDGRDGICASLRRIEGAGYLRRERQRGAGGRMGPVVWIVSDEAAPRPGDPDAEDPDGEKPDAEDPDGETPDAEKPDAEKPNRENPDMENPDAEKPNGENPDMENPDAEDPDTEKPDGENPDAEKPDTAGPDTAEPSQTKNRENKGPIHKKPTEKRKEGERAGRPPPCSRFVPPGVEEVRAFVREKGYPVDPEAFVAWYDSVGWMVGKHRMRSWRAAVVTWARRERGGSYGQAVSGPGPDLPVKLPSALDGSWD